MFNFLISREVKDDAAVIRKLSDIAFNKYSALTKDELEIAVRKDFNEDDISIKNREISFVYKELPYFRFCFIDLHRQKSCSLAILGTKKYSGFMLQKSMDSDWGLTLTDNEFSSTTAGAKSLAKIMEKKYEIFNASNYMKRFR